MSSLLLLFDQSEKQLSEWSLKSENKSEKTLAFYKELMSLIIRLALKYQQSLPWRKWLPQVSWYFSVYLGHPDSPFLRFGIRPQNPCRFPPRCNCKWSSKSHRSSKYRRSLGQCKEIHRKRISGRWWRVPGQERNRNPQSSSGGRYSGWPLERHLRTSTEHIDKIDGNHLSGLRKQIYGDP